MEEQKKKDRRVMRTKSALRQALNEIVNEKGYGATTVEDITTRANLGRTTFYLHYQDKEDLLLEGLEEQLSSIIDEFNQRPIDFWFREKNGMVIKSVLETIRKNSDLFTLMTQDQSNRAYEKFMNVIKKTAWKLINESSWTKKKIEHTTVPVDFMIEYYSGAMWSSIVWWARNNFEASIEEMANSCQMLFYPGLLKALNVRSFSDLLEN